MWANSGSRPSSAASNPHHGKQNSVASSSSSRNGRTGGAGGPLPSKREEDIWALEDSDNEDSGHADRIAKVAVEAGLGRKASSSSLALPARTASPAHGHAPLPGSSNASSLSVASPPSAAAMQVAAALKGAPTSAPRAAPAPHPHPPHPGKERSRQASYGFWERLSGLGAAVGYGSSAASSSSSNKEKERDRDDIASSYASSGYARFDEELELEDNFDGTYSVNAPSTSAAGSAGAGSGSKLLAPANIQRPSIGGASALSSGKVSTASKGKSRSIDSPVGQPGATIVGTPRARSPLGRRRSEIPRDEEEMRELVRSDVEDILTDPVNLLKKLSLADSATDDQPTTPLTSASDRPPPVDYYNPNESPPVNTAATFGASYDSPLADTSPNAAAAAVELAKKQAQARRDASRKQKFVDCLSKDTVDIAQLRKLTWAGIPRELRPIAWQLLLGYLPSPASRRVPVLARKRQEYADAVRLAFARGEASLDAALWHQIRIDVPRTNPGVPLWQYTSTQRSLEKILYVWAIRHPASGYVQGINDLATPFYQVFLSSYIDCDPEDYDIAALPAHVVSAIEADTFWCLSKLLDGIQDNYIYAQPGIHRQVARCQELCMRVDANLAKHLENEGVSFLQFSFRWFHLLFLRVLPVNSVIRMWDTYMSEGSDAFAKFHTYVCLAFLLRFSEKLRSMDFQAIMLFLQEPVDHETWSESMTELLLSEAWMWAALWGFQDERRPR